MTLTPEAEAELQHKASGLLTKMQDELRAIIGAEAIGFVAYLVFPERTIEVGAGCQRCCLTAAAESLTHVVDEMKAKGPPPPHNHGRTSH